MRVDVPRTAGDESTEAGHCTGGELDVGLGAGGGVGGLSWPSCRREARCKAHTEYVDHHRIVW